MVSVDVRWFVAGYISGNAVFAVVRKFGYVRGMEYLILAVAIVGVIFIGASVFQGSYRKKIDKAYSENTGGEND